MEYGRTGIYADAPNILLQAPYRVDWLRLEKYFANRGARIVDKAYYTGLSPDDYRRKGFLIRLSRYNHWRVVTKRSVMNSSGKLEANLDEEIKFDITWAIAKDEIDTVVLCSGDGGFTVLADRIMRLGKRFLCMSWIDRINRQLAQTASETILFDDAEVETALRWIGPATFQLDVLLDRQAIIRAGGDPSTPPITCEIVDTELVERTYQRCCICGSRGVSISHWGPLVPRSCRWDFCRRCWLERLRQYMAGRPQPAFLRAGEKTMV